MTSCFAGRLRRRVVTVIAVFAGMFATGAIAPAQDSDAWSIQEFVEKRINDDLIKAQSETEVAVYDGEPEGPQSPSTASSS